MTYGMTNEELEAAGVQTVYVNTTTRVPVTTNPPPFLGGPSALDVLLAEGYTVTKDDEAYMDLRRAIDG